MRIVISDTSPVRAFSNLGLLGLLEVLYGEVIIPHAVAIELSQPPDGQSRITLDDLDAIRFINVKEASESPDLERFLQELDPGESEALALAIELRADLLLIDELAGRSVAKRKGIEVIGVLGVLLQAKQRGIIDAISPILDQLMFRYEFFIGRQLRIDVLRSAGEQADL